MPKPRPWLRKAGLATGAVAALLFATGMFLFSLLWILATPSNLANPPERAPYLDMHVHVAGMGYGGSGAFISDALLNSVGYPFYLRAFGVTESELEARGDVLVIERLSAKIAESQAVGSAIVLALDGVVDEQGNFDRERTQAYVPNAFLAAEIKRFPNLLFGASVHPRREDAIDRLYEAAENGAVLNKWIPNIMDIDPSEERYRGFYDALRDLGLPLLSHTGMEQAFSNANDEFGDPRRLELPLSMGVTVIAAHIATTGRAEGEPQFDRFLGMFATYPNLYADISSLTQINKIGYLRRALAEPGLAERLIYGTDWPLQFFPVVSPLFHLGSISMGDAKRVHQTSSLWDRDVYLKRALGVPESVFRRGPTVLDLARKSALRPPDAVTPETR